MSKLMSEFILGISTNMIRDIVVVAPCWTPDSVGIKEARKIGDSSCQIWDCLIGDRSFTYIVTGVGAAVCMDTVLAMNDTSCKQMLFVGSAGALRKDINIGDFAVPYGVISAEGASRYVGDDLTKDAFGEFFAATNELQQLLLLSLKKGLEGEVVDVVEGIGVSVESILLQYKHIDALLNMNCSFIDMESSAFLAACNSINIQSAVLFCISDNVMQNEPLYNVTPIQNSFRKSIRRKIMPYVLEEFLKWEM